MMTGNICLRHNVSMPPKADSFENETQYTGHNAGLYSQETSYLLDFQHALAYASDGLK